MLNNLENKRFLRNGSKATKVAKGTCLPSVERTAITVWHPHKSFDRKVSSVNVVIRFAWLVFANLLPRTCLLASYLNINWWPEPKALEDCRDLWICYASHWLGESEIAYKLPASVGGRFDESFIHSFRKEIALYIVVWTSDYETVSQFIRTGSLKLRANPIFALIVIVLIPFSSDSDAR